MAGGGLADRPEDNSNENKIPSFGAEKNGYLPMEKQLTHRIFCQRIETISLSEAKQLLEDLHMLYLGQQVFLVKWAKQDFLDSIK